MDSLSPRCPLCYTTQRRCWSVHWDVATRHGEATAVVCQMPRLTAGLVDGEGCGMALFISGSCGRCCHHWQGRSFGQDGGNCFGGDL